MTNNTPQGSNIYRDQHILTASPARLVAMLYEAAITNLRRAIRAIEDGDIKARWVANARAVEIIEHLSMTLDTDKGGQIAADLERLFPFMILHLINVDVRNDPAPAHEVIKLLEPMYQSWCDLDRRVAQGTLQAEITSKPAVKAETSGRDGDNTIGGRISATV